MNELANEDRPVILSIFNPVGDMDWMDDGLCAQVDPVIFFPAKGESVLPAKKTCASCPVLDRCRQWALDNDEHFGIWGGLSENERRKIRRQAASKEGIAA